MNASNSQIGNLVNKVTSTITEVGRVALSSLHPNDLEYYLLSLELTYFSPDGKEKTLKYFSFPVMPNSIIQTEPQITNVKKNYGGLTIINSPTFVPKDITIQGNFGRQFRVLIGNVVESFASIQSTPSLKEGFAGTKNLFSKTFSKNDDPQLISQELSSYIKTGYGSIKVLQAICEQSKQIDYKRPRRLYLHNPALGHSYLVKVVNLNLNQNLQSNMIWNYNLQLKAVSPSENLEGGSTNRLSDSLTNGLIQKGLNSAVSAIKNKIVN